MATVLLAAAGSSASGLVGGGVVGSAIGRQVGGFFGGGVDDLIFGARRLPDIEGARLEELAVQTSTYGRSIPIIFGNVRIGGNIIWSLPIQETANVRTNSASGGKGGGAQVTQTSTTFTYSASLAIAICEGEIDDVIRVWADSKVVDPNLGTFRLHKGDEDQQPDSFIESFEGVG